MLRITNKTDNVLSVDNYELPGRSSIDIDIPYSSNLKKLEKYNVIAVIEIPPPVEEKQEQQKIETSVDESEGKPSRTNKSNKKRK